jgi:Tol biopolymer transport system component
MTRSNHFRVLLGVSVAALLALLLTVSATQKPAQAAFPGENGKFLYCDEADRDAPCEIFSINPDGSSRMQLTFLPLDLYTRGDTDPESSPDGSKIAFSRATYTYRDVGGGTTEQIYTQDIYVMNADGSGLREIADDPALDYGPAWSPDGSKIAFVSNRDAPVDAAYANSYDIYVTNADGTGEPIRITNQPGNESDLNWSPDGSKLLYVSTADTPAFPNPGGDAEIYAMNPDGSGVVSRLTDNTASDSTPDWSPDGKEIVFDSNRDGKRAIYKMNADGSGQAKVEYQLPCVYDPDPDAGGCVGHSAPVWSPDGTKIAFLVNIYSSGYSWALVYTMNPDGTGVSEVPYASFTGLTFDWAPKDNAPPKVINTSPKADATEVAPTANFRTTFSEGMDSNTINGTTFKLFKKGTTTQIPAQVSYNADTNTAKLDPTNNLRRGVVYKAVVTTWAKDVAGNRLDQDGSTSGLQQMRWFFRVDN